MAPLIECSSPHEANVCDVAVVLAGTFVLDSASCTSGSMVPTDGRPRSVLPFVAECASEIVLDRRSAPSVCCVAGTSAVTVARHARMAVPANIIRTGVDFSIPAPAVLQVGDHELQIVHGHEQLQCLVCFRRHPWSNRLKFERVACLAPG
eukprot:3844346-Amphidinium_carterae.2